MENLVFMPFSKYLNRGFKLSIDIEHNQFHRIFTLSFSNLIKNVIYF